MAIDTLEACERRGGYTRWETLPPGRSRRRGGGLQEDPRFESKDLETLALAGGARDAWHSESPLRWTCKSTREVAGALEKMGDVVFHGEWNDTNEAPDVELGTRGEWRSKGATDKQKN